MSQFLLLLFYYSSCKKKKKCIHHIFFFFLLSKRHIYILYLAFVSFSFSLSIFSSSSLFSVISKLVPRVKKLHSPLYFLFLSFVLTTVRYALFLVFVSLSFSLSIVSSFLFLSIISMLVPRVKKKKTFLCTFPSVFCLVTFADIYYFPSRSSAYLSIFQFSLPFSLFFFLLFPHVKKWHFSLYFLFTFLSFKICIYIFPRPLVSLPLQWLFLHGHFTLLGGPWRVIYSVINFAFPPWIYFPAQDSLVWNTTTFQAPAASLCPFICSVIIVSSIWSLLFISSRRSRAFQTLRNFEAFISRRYAFILFSYHGINLFHYHYYLLSRPGLMHFKHYDILILHCSPLFNILLHKHIHHYYSYYFHLFSLDPGWFVYVWVLNTPRS